MVALTGELGPPPEGVVDLWAIDELRGITIDGDALTLGSLTTYTDIRRSAMCREHVPALVDAAATIGAAQIQNRGTLGGNIANASPAGDTLPVLLAADAVIVVGSERGEREVPTAGFWTGYRQTALAHDELILRIRIPLVADREMRFRKVGTRRAQSISKVVMSVAWQGDGTWREVRVALGSVAATPIRAVATEAALDGRTPDPESADLAAETLAGELAPDRRRPVDRRVPPHRGCACPPPHHPRRRRLVKRRSLVALLGLGLLTGCAGQASTSSPTPLPASPEPSAATPPDGQIAFARTVFDPSTNMPTGGDLWSVATDGSNLQRLTDTPEIELFTAWSPDGSRLAFVSIESATTGDIWLIDADPVAADRHLTQFTDGAGIEGAPAWSPDGRSIAYVDDWQGAPSVWIRSSDGADDARRVTDGNWPSWTPDGKRLLITVGADFTDTELAYVSVEGGEPDILPIQLPNASEGAVSSLGAVAFVSSANDYANSDPATWNEDVYTVGPDGARGPTLVTNTPENDHWPPSWSSAGDWLAYTNDGGRAGSRIAIVLATEEPIYLTDGAFDSFPAWRPETTP